MYIKIFCVLCIIRFGLVTIDAQESFYKIIDYEIGIENRVRDLLLTDSSIYVVAKHSCYSIQDLCTSIAEFNYNGNLENLEIISSFFCAIDKPLILDKDSFAIFGYWSTDHTNSLSEIIILESDLMFSSIREHSFLSDSLYAYSANGFIKSGNSYYLYGRGNDSMGGNIYPYIIKINAKTNEIIWKKNYNGYTIYSNPLNLQVTKNGDLMFANEAKYEDSLRIEIIKLDTSGNVMSKFAFNDIPPFAVPSLLASRDGSNYIGSLQTPLEDVPLTEGVLTKLTSDLQSILWSVELPRDPFTNNRIYRIVNFIEARNGDIIAYGTVFDEDNQNSIDNQWHGFLTRITKFGSIKYLRVYKILGIPPFGDFGRYRLSSITKLVETKAGDIIALGNADFVDSENIEHYDLWMMVADSLGCISGEECEEIIVLDGRNSNIPNYLVDEDNEWYNMTMDILSGDINSHRLRFASDSTLFNGNYYKELIRSNEQMGSNWASTGSFFRESNHKVWWYSEAGEILLYDFSLNVGDTFSSNVFIREDISLVVASVDSVVLPNGDRRSVFQLHCSDDPNGTIYGKRTWIEGIGDLNGLMSGQRACNVDQVQKLLCHYNNDDLLYQDTTEGECWLTPIFDVSPNGLKLYPNPASESITIEGDGQFDEIVIYDQLGREKVRYHTTGNLDISKLESGIYYVHLSSKSEIRQIYKLVVIE